MAEEFAKSRVVLVDDDPSRSERTSSVLAAAGYEVVAERSVEHIVRLLEDPNPTVVLFDISSPGAARHMSERHSELADAIADRWPIVLYGDRTETPRTEPPAGPYDSPTRDGLLDLIAGLLPTPSFDEPPAESDRPTNPIAIGAPGSVHHISLPPDSLPRSVPASGAMPKLSPSQGDWERVRLLLIDESEMTLELMQERLAHEGADVRIAVALGEVDSIVANWSPNLVVANVRRGDLAGDALCMRLRHAVGSQELRILLCSTLPDAELRVLAMAAGADGYVSKSRGLDSFVREVVEMAMRLTPPNMALGRAQKA